MKYIGKYGIFPVVLLLLLAGCRPSASEPDKPVRTVQLKTKSPVLQQTKSRLECFLEQAGLVDVISLDSSIHHDLRYATSSNFTKVVLYDTLRTVYLQKAAAMKLVKAQRLLQQSHPELSLIIWDAARPMSIQRKMYRVVAGTPQRDYVANPSRTGLHNYGCAVDLSICYAADSSLLDMGTPFDYFGKAAGIRNEAALVEEGLLNKKQMHNRQLLRRVMSDAGFLTVKGEWWHFNAVSLAVAKSRYKVLE